MGEVGLPGLVGHGGFEPDVGRLRSLLRLGADQAVCGQLPGHRRRGDRHGVVMPQVPDDGVRACVEALVGQFLAAPDDQVDGGLLDRRRGRLRPPRPRLERGVAFGLVAGLELVDPGPVRAVTAGDLGRCLAVNEQGGEDQACLRHARASRTRDCLLCPETCVAYVLSHHTTATAVRTPDRSPAELRRESSSD